MWPSSPTPVAVLAVALLAGCDDMAHQPKIRPLAPSAFFADGRGARPEVEGAVARGDGVYDRHLQEGRDAAGGVATTLPFPATREVLLRGRERFDIFCAPCHGHAGEGDGMIVRRGFPHAPSLHEERLRAAPIGAFYDAVTSGFGAMPSYRAEIPLRDRWAIVAYVRALELSQNARIADVPADERRALEESKP